MNKCFVEVHLGQMLMYGKVWERYGKEHTRITCLSVPVLWKVHVPVDPHPVKTATADTKYGLLSVYSISKDVSSIT